MKFTIKREELIEVFSDFINILKDNPIRPIIAGLKIESCDGEVTFTGTNLEVNYIKTIKCETEENGTVVFKPNLALEYIKLLEDDYITLSSKDDILSIHLAEFILLSYDNFPENLKLPIVETIAEISAQDFFKSFEKTKYSAAPSSENLAINCVRTLFKKDKIAFVTTDSYRLTYLEINKNSLIEKDFSIPLESINVFCKLIKDIDVNITVGYNGEALIFTWNNSYFLTKVTTLPFPNFDAILANTSFSKTMEFDYSEFKSALKKVLTVARTNNDSKNSAILEFIGSKLSLSASSGKAKVKQKVNMIKTGEDFKCSLNIRFLYSFIENLDKNIIIQGSSSSSMFKITQSDDPTYKYILMPLALKN